MKYVVTQELVDRLTALRLQGLTREQIMEETGLSLSCIKRAVAIHDIPRKMSERASKRALQKEKPSLVISTDEGITLMMQAKQILGDRMSEDHRGYLLDGRPASSWQVLKAAKLCTKR